MQIFHNAVIIKESEVQHLIHSWVRSIFGDIQGITAEYSPSLEFEEPTIMLFSDTGVEPVKDAVQAKFNEMVKRFRIGDRNDTGNFHMIEEPHFLGDECFREMIEDIRSNVNPDFALIGAFPHELTRAIIAEEAHLPFIPTYGAYLDLTAYGNEKLIFSGEQPRTVEIRDMQEESEK